MVGFFYCVNHVLIKSRAKNITMECLSNQLLYLTCTNLYNKMFNFLAPNIFLDMHQMKYCFNTNTGSCEYPKHITLVLITK